MSINWIAYSDEQPTINQKVIYFFEFVGSHRGVYHGNWEFSSKRGFLGGDVTHWMPDEGQDIPKPPFAKLDILIFNNQAVSIGHWSPIREANNKLKGSKVKTIEVPVDIYLDYTNRRIDKNISGIDPIVLPEYSRPIEFI
jgi:hypothetical protein